MNYIYLHGFCSGSNSYKGSYLRKCFDRSGLRLDTPDLNGKDFSTLTLSGQLNQLEQILSETEGPIILMGSSMGALLAAIIAQKNQRIEKLILLAPAFRFASRYIDRLEPEVLSAWKDNGSISVFHYAYGEQRSLGYQIVEDARKYEEVDFGRQIPALVLHGLEDESVPYSLSIDYMRQNNLTQLVLLNTNHQMTDSIEIIHKHIYHFLGLD
ncbi:MAG: YqiA/YcfP family alpha/beta fold hydrolase [Calditrichota bacterium]